MSRILDDMLNNRMRNTTPLNKEDFYVETKGNFSVLMVKTSQEQINEDIIKQRMMSEKNFTGKISRLETIKLKKDGTPDKRFKYNKI